MQQCPLLLHDRDAIHLKKVRKKGGRAAPDSWATRRLEGGTRRISS
jgi:hypothetical protein